MLFSQTKYEFNNLTTPIDEHTMIESLSLDEPSNELLSKMDEELNKKEEPFTLAECCTAFDLAAVMFDCKIPVPYEEERKRYVFEHQDKPRLIYITEEGDQIVFNGIVKQFGYVLSIETIYFDKEKEIDEFYNFLRNNVMCFFSVDS